MHPQLGAAPVHDDVGAVGRRARRGRRATTSGGHQHAPLPAHLVLRRRGAVGVEHVALVEHRVGDRRARTRVGHRGSRHVRAPRASRSSASSQPTQPVPAAVVGEPVVGVPATRAATPGRGSARPSPRARPRPAAGPWPPCARAPARPRSSPAAPVNTCAAEQQQQRHLALLERRRGTCGPRRRRRSCTAAPGRSRSSPVKPGSTWERNASCSGCMVVPQRGRSPNRSTTWRRLARRCSAGAAARSAPGSAARAACTRTPERSSARIRSTTVGPAA